MGRAIAAALVALKLLLFYALIGVQPYFAAVWLLTCLFTLLFFSAFKNKWIPAGIYLALSLLMFADVTYNSFFNHYLSVNMFGAIDMLDDIGASIAEVLQPAFFLIPLDALAILGLLTAERILTRREEIEAYLLAESLGDAPQVFAESLGDAPQAFAAPSAEAVSESVPDAYYAEPPLFTGRREKKNVGGNSGGGYGSNCLGVTVKPPCSSFR
jgi:general stress protein CsbA